MEAARLFSAVDFLAYCGGRVTPIEVDSPLEAADQIHIEQLEVFARIGVTEEERAGSQRLVLNLTIWPRQRAELLRDTIKRAVNYSEVCESVREFAKKGSFALLETMAAELATVLLDSFAIAAARIELRKFVVADARYVAAILTRFADNG